MGKALKILVINPNSWYNKGDLGNRIGLVLALKKAFGDNICITIESLTPHKDSEYFSRFSTSVVGSIFSVKKSSLAPFIKVLNAISALFQLFLYSVFGLCVNFPKLPSLYLSKLVDSDLVISSPGGFLQEYDIRSSLLPNLYLIFLALLARKPVIIYAQSLGPFRNRLIRFISRVILDRVDVILLRERISKTYLSELHVKNPNIIVTADSCFSTMLYFREQLSKSTSSKPHLFGYACPKARMLIGVTVIGSFFLNKDKRCLLKNYLLSLGYALRKVARRYNAHILILPQVKNDVEDFISLALHKLLYNENIATYISDDLSPEDLVAIIKNSDVLIGTRMHSNIFALLSNVPVLAIAYEHKTFGIMGMLRLSDWVVGIEEIDRYELYHKLVKLIQYEEKLKETIHKVLMKVFVRSMLNAKIVFMRAKKKGLI